MAIQLDDLVARLRLDTDGMTRGLSSVDKSLGRVDRNAGRTSGSIAKNFLKITAGLAIGAKAISFVGDSLAEGREANKVSALTEQRIKTMGDVAGISAKGVGELANAISKKTGIDDEQIQSSENLLLSFSKIANQGDGMAAIFDRATRASIDLSAGGFGSIEGASKQLGKALQDPEKGISALARSGVTFTEKQQATIKSLVEHNKQLGAQKIILGEVEKQVKGSAEAQATASDKARVGWANLQEQIGVALIPVVDKLASFFADKVLPAISEFITGMQDGTGAGGDFADKVRMIWKALQQLYAILKPVFGFLIDNKESVAGFIAVLAGFSILSKIINSFRALSLVLAANPIGIAVVAIAALAAGLIYAYRHSEKFRNIVDGAMTAVGKIFRSLWNDFLAPVFRFIINGIGTVIEGIADMLGALGHVPGFGWAKDAADKMHAAADAAHNMADNIDDIPEHKEVHVDVIVNTSAISKAQHQLDVLSASTPRAASGAAAAAVGTINLPGIMRGLIDGIARSLGPLEADVTNDVAELMTRIEDTYTARGEAASKRITNRFNRIQQRLSKALKAAKKTDDKSDDKEIQGKLDGLDKREQAAIEKAIARYRRKAKAAQDAARSLAAGLIENARQQDVLNEKLDVARSNLERLQEQAASFAAGVASTFRDFGKIVGLGVRQVGEETTLTIGDMLDDLRERVAKAAKLATLIAQLTAQGLNQASIDELLAGGIDAGLAAAEAIASGGQSAVDEINALTGQLTTLGTELGASLSATFFGAGISAAQSVVDGLVLGPDGLATLQANAVTLRAQLATTLGAETKQGGRDAGHDTIEGLVDGLDDREGKLDRAMRRLAKSMIASLKDELDMHSPSRKMLGLGQLGGASFALGLDSMVDTVAASGKRLASAALVDPDTLRRGAASLPSVGRGAGSQIAVSPIDVRVFVGDREITDIVRTEVGGTLAPLRTYARQGVKP